MLRQECARARLRHSLTLWGGVSHTLGAAGQITAAEDLASFASVRGDWPPVWPTGRLSKGEVRPSTEPPHRRHVPGREVIAPPSGDTLGQTPRRPIHPMGREFTPARRHRATGVHLLGPHCPDFEPGWGISGSLSLIDLDPGRARANDPSVKGSGRFAMKESASLRSRSRGPVVLEELLELGLDLLWDLDASEV
jgi:hypothetical protein